MTAYAMRSPRSFDFGRAFTHTFRALWRNAPVLLAVNGCLWLLSAVLQLGVRSLFGVSTGTPGAVGMGAGVFGLIMGLFSLVLFAFEIGFLSAVVNHLVGREQTQAPAGFVERFQESVGVGLRKGLPLLLVYAVQIIPIYIASFFFIVPGVILSLVWYVTAPALTNEPIGIFATFNRSADLTRDNRWVLFGFSLVTGLLMAVVFYAVMGVGMITFGAMGASFMGTSGKVPAPDAAALAFFGLLISAFFTLFLSFSFAVPAGAYHELRLIRDGGQDVAKLFS